jgi:hypothetical protein
MDPSEIQALTKRRGIFKGSLTRNKHFVAQFDRSGDINKIKVRYDTLPEIWNKFDWCQSLLEEKDEAQDHEADRTEFEEMYYNLKSDMEKLLALKGHAFQLVQGILITADNLPQTLFMPKKRRVRNNSEDQHGILTLLWL